MTRIVINAAGAGTRLGKSTPKSLVPVCGRLIIDWQLNVMCAGFDDVVIVTGFRGEELAQAARAIRPSIEVRLNDRWSTTKTGASLAIGATDASGRVLSLDGDLLVAPSDLQRFAGFDHDAIGVTSPNSDQPVYAEVDSEMLCHGFSTTETGPWEWSGLVTFDAGRIHHQDGHVFTSVVSILPVSAYEIRCAEVDTAHDLEQAEAIWPKILETP